MDKKFSVIIPTYYRNDFLQRAVEGVLRQTYENYEIVIIDDSKDRHAEEAVEAIKSRTEKDVTYLFSGGVKQGAARNMGFKNCSGDLIAILDDDDLWETTKLESDYKYLKENEFNVVVYGGRTLHDKEGNITGKYLPKYSWSASHMIKLFNFVAFPALSFKKEVFTEVGYLDETLSTHEDWDFLNRLALKYQFIPIKEVQAQIYKHDNNRDKEHYDVWEKDKLEVFGRYRQYWTLTTWVFYILRQTKLKLAGRKY